MKLKNKVKSKILLKMVLWFSASALFIVGILSVVIYWNAQSLMVKKESDNNQKILFQVKYNTNLMNDAITRLAQSIFLNGDINKIMYAKEENMVDVIIRMNTAVTALTSSYPYVHSITIYNRNLDQFYNAGSPVFFNDTQLSELQDADQVLPKLKPIYRDIHKVMNGRVESEHVLSYFMYETPTNDEKPSALVINVKPEWLLENIRQINMIDPQKKSSIFLLDQQDDIVDADQAVEKQTKLNWFQQEFTRYKQSHAARSDDGSFKRTYMDTQYLVTFSYMDSIGMTLMKIQPALEVNGYLNSFKTSILFITAFVLLMAIAISVSISRKIYSPIGNLVQTISAGRMHKFDLRGTGDEISYLDSVYKQSMEQLNLFDKQRYQYEDVIKHYWLNRLLTEKVKLGQAELADIFRETKIALPLEGTYAVLLLKIDNYRSFQQTFSAQDKETIRYAIINIASEWVAKKYVNEGLDLRDDHVAIMLSLPSEGETFEEEIAALIREAQQFVQQYYKITFTASLSPALHRIEALPTLYNKALEQSVYRFIYGHRSVIDSKAVLANEAGKKKGYSKPLEEQLREAILKGDLSGIERALKPLFDEMTELSYYDAMASTFRLLETAKKTLELRLAADVSALPIDLSAFSLSIMENETLGGIFDRLVDTLGQALRTHEGGEPPPPKVNHYVVETVSEYILTHYDDPTLCLASIASMMKITQRRLGNLFKEVMGVSIADFINETRLTKAAELLTGSEVSVREIVEKVGVLNETYFFSLFKKRFGVTPKEYALQSTVKQLKQSGSHTE
ncbi:helix-turn-helix domain-containing protein [Cohnella sp. GCM10012308]|uniref:helix-turn-helix domain-containing protein n=1 Tax=Cohnella sp. GCM10012308 TaxID=3317329 RepID=UPI00361FDDD5